MYQQQLLLAFFFMSTSFLMAQQTTISFELNGRPSNEALLDSISTQPKNPFHNFIGEWTLKDDKWSQNWGSGQETIQIPNHHTVSSQINTDNSLLSIIDGPEPNGHIFWSYNPNTKEVFHLSSFGTVRAGNGKGTINEKGDLYLKLFFEGEPEGTYRIYTYTWLHKNEYHMKSIQYDQNDQPTGLFYEGSFIRVSKNSNHKIKEEIKKILKVLDDRHLSVEEQLLVFAEDIVHMAPNNEAITNKEALKDYLMMQKKYGYAEMNHRIIEFESFGNTVLMRGAVAGTFYPSNGETPSGFSTKNLFVFKRLKGELLISKVIYNNTPNN